MAIYYNSHSSLSRSQCQDVAAAYAYRSGMSLDSHHDGLRKYPHRDSNDVISCHRVTPGLATPPRKLSKLDIQSKVTALDKAEHRSNANPLKEHIFALPAELNKQQRDLISQLYAQRIADITGAEIDYFTHKPTGTDNNNHHVHALIPTRVRREDGSFGSKIHMLDKTKGGREFTLIARYELERISKQVLKAQNLDTRGVCCLSFADRQSPKRFERAYKKIEDAYTSLNARYNLNIESNISINKEDMIDPRLLPTIKVGYGTKEEKSRKEDYNKLVKLHNNSVLNLVKEETRLRNKYGDKHYEFFTSKSIDDDKLHQRIALREQQIEQMLKEQAALKDIIKLPSKGTKLEKEKAQVIAEHKASEAVSKLDLDGVDPLNANKILERDDLDYHTPTEMNDVGLDDLLNADLELDISDVDFDSINPTTTEDPFAIAVDDTDKNTKNTTMNIDNIQLNKPQPPAKNEVVDVEKIKEESDFTSKVSTTDNLDKKYKTFEDNLREQVDANEDLLKKPSDPKRKKRAEISAQSLISLAQMLPLTPEQKKLLGIVSKILAFVNVASRLGRDAIDVTSNSTQACKKLLGGVAHSGQGDLSESVSDTDPPKLKQAKEATHLTKNKEDKRIVILKPHLVDYSKALKAVDDEPIEANYKKLRETGDRLKKLCDPKTGLQLSETQDKHIRMILRPQAYVRVKHYRDVCDYSLSQEIPNARKAIKSLAHTCPHTKAISTVSTLTKLAKKAQQVTKVVKKGAQKKKSDEPNKYEE